MPQTKQSAVKKRRILTRAKQGHSKLSEYSKDIEEKTLAKAFYRYTDKKHNSYDEKFDKKIRELRPDWFITQSQKVIEKKKKLLKIAKQGLPRPSQRSKDPEEKVYGKALCRYIGNECCYDEIFAKKIRELRPDWFNN